MATHDSTDPAAAGPPLSGGCHCGACRYELAVTQLDDIAHCHCSICRRSSGALFVTWATLPAAALRWLGRPAVYISSPVARRYFCPGCGAQLAFAHDQFPDTVDITVATLDRNEDFPAGRHIWSDTRVSWLQVDQHLPVYADENWRASDQAASLSSLCQPGNTRTAG